jgi:peptidoglycan/LPS O-acetylase OafA/YrhL
MSARFQQADVAGLVRTRSQEEVNSPRIAPLTSLRFMAALMIVLLHSESHFGIGEQAFGQFPLGHGVSFFFVLSGFILTYTYPHVSTTGRLKFILHRIARLAPSHWFAFILVLLLWPDISAQLSGGTVPIPLTAALNLSMLHAWIPLQNVALSFNAASWSISTEFGFYVAFLWLSFNWTRTWYWKYIAVWCVLLVGSVVSDRLGLGNNPDADNGWNVTAVALFYFNPVFRLVEFSSGMCLALLWRFCRDHWVPGRRAASVAEASALALLGVSMFEFPALNSWMLGSGLIGPSLRIWLTRGGFSLLGVCAVVFVFAVNRGWISRFLSLPVFVALGEMSYSIYLLHQGFIVYHDAHARAFVWLPDWLQYFLFWAFLLLASVLVWRWIERPARVAIRRLTARALDGAASGGHRVAASGPPRREAVPLWALLVEMAGFLALLGFFVYAIVWRPNIEDVSVDETAQVAAATPVALRDVRFGDDFLLRGVRTTHSADGLTLEFVWQALRPANLSYINAVHLLDRHGVMIGQADYRQDPAQASVESGRTWKDVITLPEDRLRGVTALGLGIYRVADSALLEVDSGPRDWGNHRLLLEFSQTIDGG